MIHGLRGCSVLPAPDRSPATEKRKNIIMPTGINVNHQKPAQGRQFSAVPPERKRLIGAMQKYPYSKIENLAVANGNPVFGPTTRLIAETKLGGGDGARPEANLADFVLKREHVELFRQLDEIGSGVILVLEVRAGLPFRMIREVAA